MKTVFFGPWIGEFGWEFMHWHAWVDRVCKEDFKDYYKIASSYSGRKPFYPNIDKFLPHPPEYDSKFTSARNYITDHWIGLRPSPNSSNNFLKKNNKNNSNPQLPENQSKWAEDLLSSYKDELPEDTIYFVPWKLNKFKKHDMEFGVLDLGKRNKYLEISDFILVKSLKKTVGQIITNWEWLKNKDININNEGFIVKKIPFKQQKFFKLSPTQLGQNMFSEIEDSTKPIISVFPRHRKERRADKNWGEDNYLELINFLKKNYPHYHIALLGAPGGCHFVSNAPDGCIDLINIDNKSRMDIHVAALKNSVFAVGGLSGAILVSLATGCPSLTWGHADAKERAEEENLLKTKFIFLEEEHPKNNDIQNIIKENLD